MNFSLIGTGFIMPRHAEAIYYVGGKIIDMVNTAHGLDSWKEVVTNPKTDCIVILGPNDLHYPIASLALEHGKQVLCEKPLTISTTNAKALFGKEGVYTVLQLRHHPTVKTLKASIDPDVHYEVEMDISVHRDPPYYEIWKGQTARSGGVLFNLGIHYFDLLIHLFGEPTDARLTYLDDKTGKGTLEGKQFRCNFTISTDEPRDTQRRVFKINGEDYNFSSQDNLSYENLHRPIYQDLLEGKGTTPEEAYPSIALVERLYSSADLLK